MVRAEGAALAERLGVTVLRRAGDRAPRPAQRVPGAAHAMVVAEEAAAAQRRGVSVAGAAPDVTAALAVLLDAGAAHARVLVGMVVAAVELATPQRTSAPGAANDAAKPPLEAWPERLARIAEEVNAMADGS